MSMFSEMFRLSSKTATNFFSPISEGFIKKEAEELKSHEIKDEGDG